MKNIGLRDITSGHLSLGDTYYPLESTVHISHIAQHAVAGERHAFLFEKTGVRRQKTECWHAETAETAEPLVISSEAERSREILSCRNIAKREKISHRLHRFSQNFQCADKLCSQASGLHGTAKRREETHRAKAVISSAAKRSREILSRRSIAKREKISHRLHRFSRIFQSDDRLCSQASGLHRAGRRGNVNNRDTNLRDGSL